MLSPSKFESGSSSSLVVADEARCNADSRTTTDDDESTDALSADGRGAPPPPPTAATAASSAVAASVRPVEIAATSSAQATTTTNGCHLRGLGRPPAPPAPYRRRPISVLVFSIMLVFGFIVFDMRVYDCELDDIIRIRVMQKKLWNRWGMHTIHTIERVERA